MKKLTVTELKKELKLKSNDELIKEILELYKKFPDVKDYYSSNLSTGGMLEVLEKYKKIVQNEFFPSRGFSKLRLSVAKKAVNDFKKTSNSDFDIADIMFHYVENGVEFTNEYGDIDDPFYSSMESMFETALKFICKSEITKDFYTRCKQIVDDTSGMEWGFHDQLSYLFENYLEKNKRT
jgi:hypothetical protein